MKASKRAFEPDVDNTNRARNWSPHRRARLSIVSKPCYAANQEPRLDQVLGDPIVRLMMKRDRVDMAALLLLIDETQRRLIRCSVTL